MRKPKSLLVVLLSLLIFFSCRKHDSEITIPENSFSIERFFNLPASTNPRLKGVALSIRKQENGRPFLKDLITKGGWPVWDKSKIITKPIQGGRSATEDNSTLYYIPLVPDTVNTVKAVLAVYTGAGDTTLRVLFATNYSSFGFDSIANGAWNARNVFQFFALFQHDIFGTTKFLIKDERLFNLTSDSCIATLKNRNGSPISGRTTELHEVTECLTVTLCPKAAAARTTDDCYDITNCNTYYWDDGIGPGGGTSWTGGSWGNPTGGGGGSGGGGGNNDPCGVSTTGAPLACPPGWEPVPAPPNVDSRGYYLDRIALLDAILQQDPYFVMPCQYLAQFQMLGSFQPPQQITDRINTVNADWELYIAQNGPNTPGPRPHFDLQMLDNAAGTVVNCDYFPIHITTLPIVNGVQWTAQDLFLYFRFNWNTLVNTNIASFQPYVDPVVNDVNLWNSPDPMTSILHIDMLNDGAVIVSDFDLQINSSLMKASTLESPYDISHPVSGTRQWGIKPDTEHGGYVFYTTGVDRITDKLTEIIDGLVSGLGIPSGFETADNLWRSLQDKMIDFITIHNGQAARYSNVEITSRPDYSAVREFLLGHIDLQTMRQMLGC